MTTEFSKRIKQVNKKQKNYEESKTILKIKCLILKINVVIETIERVQRSEKLRKMKNNNKKEPKTPDGPEKIMWVTQLKDLINKRENNWNQKHL